MTVNRVFLVCPVSRFDTSPASAHGQVHTLFRTTKDVNAFGGQATFDKIIEKLEKLDYDAETDMVALSGPVAAVTMLVLAASELSDRGEVKLLVFDARDGSYRARVVCPSKKTA